MQETTDKSIHNHNNGEVVTGQLMSNLANPLWIPLARSCQVGRMLQSIKSLDTIWPPITMAHFHVSDDVLAMSVDGFRCMNEIGTRMLLLILWSLLLICYIHIIYRRSLWHENAFRITGLWRRESTGHWWIPAKGTIMKNCCVSFIVNQKRLGKIVELLENWVHFHAYMSF